MSKASAWKGAFGQERDSGSRVTVQLATDLSARQVNAQINPGGPHCSVSFNWDDQTKENRGKSGKENCGMEWLVTLLNVCC